MRRELLIQWVKQTVNKIIIKNLTVNKIITAEYTLLSLNHAEITKIIIHKYAND